MDSLSYFKVVDIIYKYRTNEERKDSLKLQVILLWYLEEKYQTLDPYILLKELKKFNLKEEMQEAENIEMRICLETMDSISPEKLLHTKKAIACKLKEAINFRVATQRYLTNIEKTTNCNI